MPTRRVFIVGMSSLWAMPLLAQRRPRRGSVLVIGAGIAGLACGRALHDAGFSVTILEARDRIGGRIHTDRSLNVPIDLGAAWIHGANGNPITDLAKAAKVKTIESDSDQLQLRWPDQRVASAPELQQIEQAFRTLRRQLREARKTAPPTKAISDALGGLLSDVPEVLRPAVRWQVFSEIELSLGTDAVSLSLAAWDRDESFGGPELVFPQGYDQLTTFLSRGLTIQLKSVVRSIEVTEQQVNVQTAEQTYVSDSCVVTLPLGVLQAQAVRFTPELPAAKRDAIRRLGSGRFCKMAVLFEKPFWPEALHRLAVMSEPHFEVWSLWSTHRSPTLVLLASGPTAARWERLKPADREAKTVRQLRRIFPKVPPPQGVIVTTWGVDPLTLGAYSSVPPNAGLKDFETLAQPVGQRLGFAGEATSRDYPGTVHGAYLSGVREAKRLIGRDD